jgi:3-isopropylmalate dehydratase small subunit
MGRVWRFGNNINTDQIIPGRYYPRENVEELGEFCLAELNPEFSKNKSPGDILVAGHNFGCGSSREYAPIALKHSGIKCVIARSFARIFYRNCINIGFPIMVCDPCYNEIEDGDILSVDLVSGAIINETRGASFQAESMPPFILEIVEAGGIIEYLKSQYPGGF